MPAAQRHTVALGQLQHRRCWHRQHAMGRGHRAAAGRRGQTADGMGLQMIKGSADAHHIHQAVDSTHFVEMHLFRAMP